MKKTDINDFEQIYRMILVNKKDLKYLHDGSFVLVRHSKTGMESIFKISFLEDEVILNDINPLTAHSDDYEYFLDEFIDLKLHNSKAYQLEESVSEEDKKMLIKYLKQTTPEEHHNLIQV